MDTRQACAHRLQYEPTRAPGQGGLGANKEGIVAAHEFGHTLGMDDIYNASYRPALMYYQPTIDAPRNTPQAHDKSDYHSRWDPASYPDCNE
jgi:arylsulfatase A-like enzyme